MKNKKELVENLKEIDTKPKKKSSKPKTKSTSYNDKLFINDVYDIEYEGGTLDFDTMFKITNELIDKNKDKQDDMSVSLSLLKALSKAIEVCGKYNNNYTDLRNIERYYEISEKIYNKYDKYTRVDQFIILASMMKFYNRLKLESKRDKYRDKAKKILRELPYEILKDFRIRELANNVENKVKKLHILEREEHSGIGSIYKVNKEALERLSQ